MFGRVNVEEHFLAITHVQLSSEWSSGLGTHGLFWKEWELMPPTRQFMCNCVDTEHLMTPVPEMIYLASGRELRHQ